MKWYFILCFPQIDPSAFKQCVVPFVFQRAHNVRRLNASLFFCLNFHVGAPLFYAPFIPTRSWHFKRDLKGIGIKRNIRGYRGIKRAKILRKFGWRSGLFIFWAQDAFNFFMKTRKFWYRKEKILFAAVYCVIYRSILEKYPRASTYWLQGIFRWLHIPKPLLKAGKARICLPFLLPF